MIKKIQALRSVDSPLYNYWQGLYLSFYSRRLYVDVVKRWRGLGMLYLLLSIALASIPLTLRVIINFNHYFEEKITQPLKELPPLVVQNGQILFDQPMPYFIKNKKGQVVAIVDTTGAINKINDSYPELTILITKNKIHFRPARLKLFVHSPENPETNKTIYTHALEKEDNEIFVGKEWVKSMGLYKLKIITQTLVYPMITLFFFGIYLVFMFVFAMLGQLLAHIFFRIKITFKEACRVFAVAATPQVLFLFGIISFNASFTGLGYFNTALIAIYFSYALLSIKRERTQLVHM